jgi:hypothetical protein
MYEWGWVEAKRDGVRARKRGSGTERGRKGRERSRGYNLGV